MWMKRKRESHVEAEKYVLHPEVYADRTGDGDDARADAGGAVRLFSPYAEKGSAKITGAADIKISCF